MTLESDSPTDEHTPTIPTPGSEPIIGVIDTRFDKRNAYFTDWVDYHDEINPELGDEPEDYVHGTEVTSIIVDGPTLNPSLDDGCGRSASVISLSARDGRNSSFAIIQVDTTHRRHAPRYHGLEPVPRLDSRDAREHRFSRSRTVGQTAERLRRHLIVAGTNKTEEDDPDEPKRLGAPGRFHQLLVVNATSLSSEPASYTRQGPALRFFRKPDVSYFGGDSTGRMTVYGPSGIAYTNGTSFAAPWIARKIAYLIHVMNLSRETAKALLIDAASGWAQPSADNAKLRLRHRTDTH